MKTITNCSNCLNDKIATPCGIQYLCDNYTYASNNNLIYQVGGTNVYDDINQALLTKNVPINRNHFLSEMSARNIFEQQSDIDQTFISRTDSVWLMDDKNYKTLIDMALSEGKRVFNVINNKVYPDAPIINAIVIAIKQAFLQNENNFDLQLTTGCDDDDREFLWLEYIDDDGCGYHNEIVENTIVYEITDLTPAEQKFIYVYGENRFGCETCSIEEALDEYFENYGLKKIEKESEK